MRLRLAVSTAKESMDQQALELASRAVCGTEIEKLAQADPRFLPPVRLIFNSSTRKLLIRVVVIVFVVVVTLLFGLTRNESTSTNQTTMSTNNSGSDSLSVRHLSIVTMNVAEFRFSDKAPASWTETNQLDAVRNEIFGSQPDIVMLQEAPPGPIAPLLGENDDVRYVEMGRQRAHAGFVSLLVKLGSNSNVKAAQPIQLPWGVPAVMAKLELVDGFQMNVASMHLAPFDGGAPQRIDQVKQMIQVSGSSGDGDETVLLMAGDTNMRDYEDKVMEQDLGLIDVWKSSGASKETRNTWNTAKHPGLGARSNEVWQNLYYGDDTRAYVRRYDRVYLKLPLHSQTVSVPEFSLIANQPIAPSTNHFLSDHFGIATMLEFFGKISGNKD